MRRRFQPAELRGKRLWWVASLEFGGHVWRLSSAPLDIEWQAEGRWLRVAAGLGGAEATLTAPWLGKEPEQRSVSVTLDIPELDVGLWLSRGYSLDAAPLEVALWREGDDWTRRLVLLSGQVTGYRWGAQGESIEIEAAEDIADDLGQLPEPGAVVDAVSWPFAPQGAAGAAYPWILGAPGSSTLPGAPAVVVESIAAGGAADLLLVAGHEVTATSCFVSDGENIESLAISHQQDGRGRLVAVVDLGTATSITVDPDNSYSTGWASGGLPAEGGGEALGAGAVIEAVLRYSSLRIDRGAIAAARQRVDGLLVGAYIQEPISPLAWVADALLPMLPVAALTGPAGWRLVPVGLEPTLADCIATLTPGPSLVRDGLVELDGRDEVATRIELAYAIDADSGDATRRIVAGPSVATGEHPTLRGTLAAQRYGRRVESLESVALYDDASAARAATWAASVRAAPRFRVRYISPIYQWLQPGDLVRLSDADLHLDAPAWVEEVALSVDGAAVTLLIWRRDAP